MSVKLLHLVRHGEVDNPDGVLYGRIPGFRLSAQGVRMAEAVAKELASSDRNITTIIASPLERTRQSARPIAEIFGVPIHLDERIIEPSNAFEGMALRDTRKNPLLWYRFMNPLRPSWGESYRSIAHRVRAAMDDAWQTESQGDVVMVSHQAVIWAAHRNVNGKLLAHNPAKRRCELSSITTFECRGGRWFEVDYRTPAAKLQQHTRDVGAV